MQPWNAFRKTQSPPTPSNLHPFHSFCHVGNTHIFYPKQPMLAIRIHALMAVVGSWSKMGLQLGSLQKNFTFDRLDSNLPSDAWKRDGDKILAGLRGTYSDCPPWPINHIKWEEEPPRTIQLITWWFLHMCRYQKQTLRLQFLTGSSCEAQIYQNQELRCFVGSWERLLPARATFSAKL